MLYPPVLVAGAGALLAAQQAVAPAAATIERRSSVNLSAAAAVGRARPAPDSQDAFRGSVASDAATGAVPEPVSWALMIVGFGGVGAMLRTRRLAAA